MHLFEHLLENFSVTSNSDQNGHDLNNEPRPAAQLHGLELPNGWIVDSLLNQTQDSTGGTFSVPYVVHSESKGSAFLKAMDYRSSFEGDSVMNKLLGAILTYQHELSLLQECDQLTRVVRLIDHGETHADPKDAFSSVFYLIFELAECDIRSHVKKHDHRNIAHLLDLMHNTTVAIQQLHNRQIAHLDVKPSNVLIFGQQGAKLADLGRSIKKDQPSPLDALICVGDPKYAPPETFYHDTQPEWNTHRLGCDFYLLGNLIFFLLFGHSITQIVLNRLYIFNPLLHPTNQSASYEEALPFVNRIFLHLIQEIRENLEFNPASEIVNILRQLCDPDPAIRGLPMNRGVYRYSLQRLVSKFNLLYKRHLFSQLYVTPIYQEPNR